MKPVLSVTKIAALVLLFTGAVLAKEKKLKPGPLSGTWQCTSHGGPHGDMNFTLDLQQTHENVTGTVTSPIGSTEISGGSYKKKAVEIHIDASPGTLRVDRQAELGSAHRRVVLQEP